jgi:dTDP-glucose pyrophosphorylase
MSVNDMAARLRRAYLKPGSTLQDAIASLNESALQIVLVVGEGDTLVGTVTDGDIRRGLLAGLTLASPLDSVVQRHPLIAPPQMPRERVLQLMQINKVQQLPIVDGHGRVVGLHQWDEMIAPAAHDNAIVIMAGGRGVRLHPHTENCPKPLLPVGGKPILEHILQRASAEGFRKFVIAVHYLGHMIEDYFRNGARWSVEIEYIREEVPLGTAGALAHLPQVPQAPIVVTNGDILTDVRYAELIDYHTRHAAAATMAVRLHEWQHPFGVVRTRGVDIVEFEEKPVARSHVNAGIYVLDPSALQLLDGKPCDMPALFERLKNRGLRTIAYPMHEPWLDVGVPDQYREAANGES